MMDRGSLYLRADSLDTDNDHGLSALQSGGSRTDRRVHGGQVLQYDQLDVGDDLRIHQGMSTDEITRVMGRPDESWGGAGRKYAHQFGCASGSIDGRWDEWVWNSAWPRIYIAYVPGGTVRKIGVVRDSPLPPES